MKRILPVLLLTALPAFAQTPGSNINLSQYPAPSCEKPQPVSEAQKPAPPPPNATNDFIESYNRKVDAYNVAMRGYNAQMTAYGSCIQAYVANGNADLRRIQDAVNAAVTAANAR